METAQNSVQNKASSRVSVCEFNLESHRRFLQRLVENGGPTALEYEELTNSINQAAAAVERDVLAADDLRHIWSGLGDAVTSTKTMQGFVWMKPHGYTGDFEIIDRIYQCWISPDPRLAKWDEYFHAQAAPRAVRNRKTYFLSWLRSQETQNNHDKLRVLNLGSGSGRDVFEYVSRNGISRAVFECVDHDAKAIAYAKSLCAGFLDRIKLHQANALRYQPSSQPYLIWSAGLFDYLNGRLALLLLRRLWRWLPLNGELVIGNFSPANPTRAYMELLGGWSLHYRSEGDLRNLAVRAGIPIGAVQINRERENINLFLHARKGNQT